ncbi:MAG: hypothetical protein VB031_09015 [Eubacteriaceae bacterium]|nr:hypothetical protein [Eubacteriaceae bacterium]
MNSSQRQNNQKENNQKENNQKEKALEENRQKEKIQEENGQSENRKEQNIIYHKAKADSAKMLDRLTGAMIGMARACHGELTSEAMDRALIAGLFMIGDDVNFDAAAIQRQTNMVRGMKKSMVLECDMDELMAACRPDEAAVKSKILTRLSSIAEDSYHALALKRDDQEVIGFLYDALFAVGSDGSPDGSVAVSGRLIGISEMADDISIRAEKLLAEANAAAFGEPTGDGSDPADGQNDDGQNDSGSDLVNGQNDSGQTAEKMTGVAMIATPDGVDPGPFIIVSGDDLKDMDMLLQQSAGRGINIYTHGAMLSAHRYPGLKKHPHLKGHFGSDWKNQQEEFTDMPGPVIFTGKHMLPPNSSYKDRAFTSGPVAFPGVMHIFDDKDFSPVIDRAIELGGRM